MTAGMGPSGTKSEVAAGVNPHLLRRGGPHGVIQGLGRPAHEPHGLIKHSGHTPGAVRRHRGRAVKSGHPRARKHCLRCQPSHAHPHPHPSPTPTPPHPAHPQTPQYAHNGSLVRLWTALRKEGHTEAVVPVAMCHLRTNRHDSTELAFLTIFCARNHLGAILGHAPEPHTHTHTITHTHTLIVCSLLTLAT
jgi:hypothetical protein